MQILVGIAGIMDWPDLARLDLPCSALVRLGPLWSDLTSFGLPFNLVQTWRVNAACKGRFC